MEEVYFCENCGQKNRGGFCINCGVIIKKEKINRGYLKMKDYIKTGIIILIVLGILMRNRWVNG